MLPQHPVSVSIAGGLWCLLPCIEARRSLLLNDHMDIQVFICKEGGPGYVPGASSLSFRGPVAL